MSDFVKLANAMIEKRFSDEGKPVEFLLGARDSDDLQEHEAASIQVAREANNIAAPISYNDLSNSHNDLVASIKDLTPFEAVTLVNQFTNDRIVYSHHEMKTESIETTSYKAAMDRKTGDCDNYATEKLGLIKAAGIDLDSAYFVGAVAVYETQDKELQDNLQGTVSNGGGHALAVVNINGSHYVLDSNLQDPVLLTDTFEIQGISTKANANGDYDPVKMSFVPMYIAPALGPDAEAGQFFALPEENLSYRHETTPAPETSLPVLAPGAE